MVTLKRFAATGTATTDKAHPGNPHRQLQFALATAVIISLMMSVLLPANQANASMPPQSGEIAPNWILTDATGKSVVFYSDSEDHQAVIVFWATWCPYCKELLPKLDELRQAAAGQAIKFYALDVWDDQNPSGYFKDNNYGLQLLLKAEPVAQRWGVAGTPGVFVINTDKRITYIRQPGTSARDTIANIKQALGLADR